MQESAEIQMGPEDAALVAAVLAGDRQAFARIVERYQALICSLAYSATGDLHRSEDVAQDTFLIAWQRLNQLREPPKLRAWLCGIARNRLKTSRRADAPAGVQTHSLERVAEIPAPEPAPSERVISREEEVILWRALEQIPELYREPLVLFYREGESIGRVSQALEISEEAVKQRLSRGRRMLHEQVAGFVEDALRHSSPGRAFTLAVLAALPAMAVSAHAATLGASAAKGTALAKSAASAGLAGALLGPIIGLIGGWIGARASIQNTESPRERQFMTRVCQGVFGFVAVVGIALALLLANSRELGSSRPRLYAGLVSGVIFTQLAGLTLLTAWTNRRQQQIRAEERLRRGMALESTGPAGAGRRFEYRSKAVFLGLPLVHIAFGNELGAGRSPAKGWIAIGDTALGVLFASGGIAAGGVALGGLALGGLTIGGAAVGILAFGGGAMGWSALGGAALAWKAAFGGLAMAHDYALGGTALAAHANDEAARAVLSWHSLLHRGTLLSEALVWFLILGLAMISVLLFRRRRA